MSIDTTAKVEVTYGSVLTSVETLPDYMLRLTYADGAEFVYDVKPTIACGGIMAALAEQTIFSQAKLGEGGTYVEFPGEIDFCADGLRYEAELQKRGLPMPE